MKLHYASRHAKLHTPAQALLKMCTDDISVGLRPTQKQLKNQRPTSVSAESQSISVDCIADLRSFLQNPRANVRIHEDQLVLTEECVRLPFSCPCLDVVLAGATLPMLCL